MANHLATKFSTMFSRYRRPHSEFQDGDDQPKVDRRQGRWTKARLECGTSSTSGTGRCTRRSRPGCKCQIHTTHVDIAGPPRRSGSPKGQVGGRAGSDHPRRRQGRNDHFLLTYVRGRRNRKHFGAVRGRSVSGGPSEVGRQLLHLEPRNGRPTLRPCFAALLLGHLQVSTDSGWFGSKGRTTRPLGGADLRFSRSETVRAVLSQPFSQLYCLVTDKWTWTTCLRFTFLPTDARHLLWRRLSRWCVCAQTTESINMRPSPSILVFPSQATKNMQIRSNGVKGRDHETYFQIWDTLCFQKPEVVVSQP